MNGLIRFGLGLANVPDDLVGDIEKAIPGAGRLIAAAKQMDPDLRALEPIYERMAPHVTALLPMIAEAMPVIERLVPQIKAAYPDITAILPTAQKVVTFVGGKK